MRLPRALLKLQDRLAALLGCEPSAREGVVVQMLTRSPRESTAYWLQLVVAVGIATLGLALGSTAVVIAAMLVAPLMGPIVGLGLGLAVGSPFLVLRASARVVASVGVVIALSAGLTRLLPFHDVNAEIAARTSPTALDLGTAVFCAMAGVYASMRPTSDVATTAAGTSIGISLVPPLCVSGYGVGTTTWSIASGAALLFVTNFVAIVFVGTLAFALAGFGQVNARRLEAEQLGDGSGAPRTRAVARFLSSLFATRGGAVLRLLMPLALLAAVYAPLRRGLDEVAWQIRARDAVERAIGALPNRVVESRVRVEHGKVGLVIFLFGGEREAQQARARLTEAIGLAAGVAPSVEVYAVADATAFEALERALEKAPEAPPPPEAAPPPAPSARISDAQQLVRQALDDVWPRGSAGEIARAELSTRPDRLELHVVHLGAPLQAPARETLERAVARELGLPVRLRSSALEPVEDSDDLRRLLEQLPRPLESARQLDDVSVCVTEPPAKNGAAGRHDKEQRTKLDALLALQPRVVRTSGERWSVRYVVGSCDGQPPQ